MVVDADVTGDRTESAFGSQDGQRRFGSVELLGTWMLSLALFVSLNLLDMLLQCSSVL